jgi:hypothetical protein
VESGAANVLRALSVLEIGDRITIDLKVGGNIVATYKGLGGGSDPEPVSAVEPQGAFWIDRHGDGGDEKLFIDAIKLIAKLPGS